MIINLNLKRLAGEEYTNCFETDLRKNNDRIFAARLQAVARITEAPVIGAISKEQYELCVMDYGKDSECFIASRRAIKINRSWHPMIFLIEDDIDTLDIIQCRTVPV